MSRAQMGARCPGRALSEPPLSSTAVHHRGRGSWLHRPVAGRDRAWRPVASGSPRDCRHQCLRKPRFRPLCPPHHVGALQCRPAPGARLRPSPAGSGDGAPRLCSPGGRSSPRLEAAGKMLCGCAATLVASWVGAARDRRIPERSDERCPDRASAGDPRSGAACGLSRRGRQHVALQHGVEGWVRNCHDGTVEAVFAGPAGVVAEMIEACGRGPLGAQVDALDQREGGPDDVALRRRGEIFSVLPTA